MKQVKSKSGETELQVPEYCPDGPVRLSVTAPDERKMVNRSDGSPSQIDVERPVYSGHPADKEMHDVKIDLYRLVRATATDLDRLTASAATLAARVSTLEAQVKSLQSAAPKGIPGLVKAK